MGDKNSKKGPREAGQMGDEQAAKNQGKRQYSDQNEGNQTND